MLRKITSLPTNVLNLGRYFEQPSLYRAVRTRAIHQRVANACYNR